MVLLDFTSEGQGAAPGVCGGGGSLSAPHPRCGTPGVLHCLSPVAPWFQCMGQREHRDAVVLYSEMGRQPLSLQPGMQICEPSFASAFQPGPGMAAGARDPLEPQAEAAGGCQASTSPSWGLCCCWGPRPDQPSSINSSLYYHLLCVAFHLKKGNSMWDEDNGATLFFQLPISFQLLHLHPCHYLN